MNPNFERVFWHEIGHLIAHHYIGLYYDGLGVDRVQIFEHDINGRIDYEGLTTPKKPQGIPVEEHPFRLHNKVATSVYGCYFQSFFLGSNFEACFDTNNPSAHGCKDSQQFWDALRRFNVTNDKKDELFDYIKLYQKSLQGKEIFKNLFATSISGMHSPSGCEARDVDIAKVIATFDQFLTEHEQNFKEFIERIKQIIG